MKKVFVLFLISCFAFSVSAINYWYVASDGTGTKAQGSTWATAFKAETLSLASVAAGDYIFVKGGAYTLATTVNCGSIAGTAIAPISLIGVKVGTTNVGASIVYADLATDSSTMPHWNFTGVPAGVLTTGNYWTVRYLYAYGVYTGIITTGTYSIVKSCIANCTYSSSGARWCFNMGSGSVLDSCTAFSLHCGGTLAALGTRVLNCNFYNMPDATNGIGVSCASANCVIWNCTFKNIKAYGINYTSQATQTALNNTFDSCGTAIGSTTGYAEVGINNIMDGCTYPINSTTQTNINYWSHEHIDNTRNTNVPTGVDVTGLYQDFWVTTGDPKFVNAGTNNLQLQAGSPCLSNGEGR